MKSIWIPLRARIRQMSRGIPVSPCPETKEKISVRSAARSRTTPVVPAIAEGADEKERIPSRA